LTNILAGPHWLPSISPDRFSRLPSGSRSPRGAHRAADRQPAAADVTLLSVRGAVDRAETPGLPSDGYPVTPTTLSRWTRTASRWAPGHAYPVLTSSRRSLGSRAFLPNGRPARGYE